MEYGGQLTWTVRLGCLGDDWQPDWQAPAEPPADAAKRAASYRRRGRTMQMPMNPDLWLHEGVAPANNGCVAVKAAQLQDPGLGDAMARAIRERRYVAGRDPNQRASVEAVARQLAARHDHFDLARFHRDLDGEAVRALGRDFAAARQPLPSAPDTRVVAGQRRYCYPSFVFKVAAAPSAKNSAVALDYTQGAAEFQDYVRAIDSLAPGLERTPVSHLDACFARHPSWATEELVQVLQQDRSRVEELLNRALAAGELAVKRVGPEALWYLPEVAHA